MDNSTKIEAFLTEIITLFSDKFGKKAILRGGMVLRLLDSPRLTNDLEYLFVPFESKKDIVKPILEALSELPETKITYSLNSQCLRITLTRSNNLNVQIEAKVSSHCKTISLSTAPLANLHNLTPRVVSAMDPEISFAHKLGAWNERRLARDLYDIYLFVNMGIRPNEKILLERLLQPKYPKNTRKKASVKTVNDFYKFFCDEVSKIKKKELKQELSPLLRKEELLGLDLKIKGVVLKAFA